VPLAKRVGTAGMSARTPVRRTIIGQSGRSPREAASHGLAIVFSWLCGLPGRESLAKRLFCVRAVVVNNGNEQAEETLGALGACILRSVFWVGLVRVEIVSLGWRVSLIRLRAAVHGTQDSAPQHAGKIPISSLERVGVHPEGDRRARVAQPAGHRAHVGTAPDGGGSGEVASTGSPSSSDPAIRRCTSTRRGVVTVRRTRAGPVNGVVNSSHRVRFRVYKCTLVHIEALHW
jgi:hypothetical protein